MSRCVQLFFAHIRNETISRFMLAVTTGPSPSVRMSWTGVWMPGSACQRFPARRPG